MGSYSAAVRESHVVRGCSAAAGESHVPWGCPAALEENHVLWGDSVRFGAWRPGTSQVAMGRPLPPGLSDPDRLALSQFFAGHLTAGQLSERLQRTDQRSESSSGRPAKRLRRHRRVVPVAAGGVVAATAIAAVAFAVSSHPHVVATHRANTGQGEPLHEYGSSRAVSDARATSSPRPSSAASGERIALAGGSAPTTHKPKSHKRNRHGFRSSKPRHVGGSAPPAGTVSTRSSTGAGGTTPTVTTPTVTTPPGTITPRGTTTPAGTATPPRATPPGGATGAG